MTAVPHPRRSRRTPASAARGCGCTLGSHLRCYAWGNVRQLEKAGREFLVRLAGEAPLLPGAETLAFIGIDSMQKRVYGHHKQGAKFGHTKIQGKSLLVRGLNALAAVVSTPVAAPVIAVTRLRGGNAPSARGAASMAAQAIGAARACGCSGTIIVRMDSAFYQARAIRAVRQGGARPARQEAHSRRAAHANGS